VSRQKAAAFKKAAQKFLLLWARGVVADTANDPASQKFFASFFQKRSTSFP
jgi:hypothetical protein